MIDLVNTRGLKPPAWADGELIDAVIDALSKKSSRTHRRDLDRLLKPRGVSDAAVRLALRLGARGTTLRPNARLRGYGGRTRDSLVITRYRDNETAYRAAYILNAATRMQTSMDNGDSPAKALRREGRWHKQHEQARRKRLEASTGVEKARDLFGWKDDRGERMVGWYHNPLANNTPDCVAASGHNFYPERGTWIGLPGAVHPGCQCYAGPYIPGAGMVDDYVRQYASTHVPEKFRIREPGYKKGRAA
ncbi:MAG: hypothetical protein ACRDQA_14260 [Nocardioidaceae bacterium]